MLRNICFEISSVPVGFVLSLKSNWILNCLFIVASVLYLLFDVIFSAIKYLKINSAINYEDGNEHALLSALSSRVSQCSQQLILLKKSYHEM